MKRLEYGNYMWRVCFDVFLFMFISYPMFALGQGFKVKEFKMQPFDVTASTQQRNDSLGIPCGLVKVCVENPQIKFSGNVVGPVQNKTNEYWVYLPKGTKSLTINRKQYLPMILNFSDYGINEIESKVVYQLRLKEISYNSSKNSLIVNVKPKKSLLEVDGIGIERDPDGSYFLLLEKGEHVCRVSHNNYSSKIEVVTIGSGSQQLNINLESLMADVIIECETTDAIFYIDNKEIGVGKWEGNLPAGDYVIVAKKTGYIPQTLEISLSEKEKRKITFTELKREMFPLSIKSTPSVCFNRKVIIDGKTIGGDSICTAQISAGNHTIEIEITGCKKINEKKYIESTDTLVYNLYPNTDAYKAAYQYGIIDLLKMTRKTYGDESFFWGDLVCNQLLKLDEKDIVKLWEKNVSDWTFLIDQYYCSQERRNKAYTLLEKFESCNVDANFLAKNYYNMKDYEKALPWYLKSLKSVSYESVPNLSDKYYTIGICYKELGNYLKAIEFCNKAEKVYSGNVPPKEFLGECYLHIGDKNMAIKWFRAALKCYIEGNFFGKEQFLERMKSIGLYNEVAM